MILVIDKSKRNAQNLTEMFHYMGFLSFASTFESVFGELNEKYRAIVMSLSAKNTACEELASKISEKIPRIPIFSICDSAERQNSGVFALSFPQGCYASKIAENIITYCDGKNLPLPGNYVLYDIDASADLGAATYNSEKLPFTKTENMIVRYLIRSFPYSVCAEEILKYSFRPSRRPEAANIRTHISSINKKFRMISGSNLIKPTFKEGYRIDVNKEAITI